jgi:outer membrane protein assembly factor BamB
MKQVTRLAATIAFVSHCLIPVRAAEWPEWRGPGGQGHAEGDGYAIEWNETKSVQWKTPIEGRAWSTPVVDGDKIWMTSAIETLASPEEAERRLKENTGDQPLTLLEKVDLHAISVEISTGKIIDNIRLLTVKEPQWVHKLNSYASPSPIVEDGKLYCHFGALGNACLDTASGKVIWTNTELVVMHENGPGSTPVIVGPHLIFHMDGSDEQYIVALDKSSGKVAWKTKRSGAMHDNPQLRKSYGTPLVMERDGKTQVISPASNWVYGIDPTTGQELWKVEYGILGFSLTPRPVMGHDMFYMSTGFMKPELLAISLKEETPTIAWRYTKNVPTMPSPILVGDELYFTSDGGILTCLDAKTGVDHYRERMDGKFSSSPILAGGHLYFGSQLGETVVVKPGKTFQIVARNQLPDPIMASPVAVNGTLFIRTETALYSIATPQ